MRNKLVTTSVLIAIMLLIVGCADSSSSNQAAVQSASTLGASNIANPTPGLAEQPNWPVLAGGNPSDQTQVEVVKAAIQHSYRVQWEADWNNFDYTQLSTVYADDPAAPLLGRQQKFVQDVIKMQGDQVKALLQGSGYLTLMTAQQLNVRKADENWALTLAKAKADGRGPNNLTPEEQRSINEGVVGGAGGYTDPQATKPAYVEPPFQFKEIKVDGNYADVTYDSGTALLRAFLVKTASGWKIAGTVALNAHF